MGIQELQTKNKYYLAANSSSGFKNFFSEIFNPDTLDKFFIIKGGPGTGQSTLMKQAATLGEELDCYTEAIYCSSDVTSLDGVLLSKNGVSIAFVDGTAPHEFEPKYPGAVEEIINLGQSWDEGALRKRRDEIVAVNKLKLGAYTEAYEKLGISFIFHSKIAAESKKHFDFQKCKTDISFIIPRVTEEIYTEKIRLVSAFSKLGFTSLSTVFNTSDKVIRLGGNKYSKANYMNTLRSALRRRGISHTTFLSPYDTNDAEGVYLPCCGLGIICSDKEYEVNADLYCSDFCSGNFEEMSALENKFIEQAKNHLNEASENHFLLEEIYKSAMDFDKNEKLASSVMERCRKILS